MRFRETWGISGPTDYNDFECIADAEIRRAGISIGDGLQQRRESKRNAFPALSLLVLSSRKIDVLGR